MLPLTLSSIGREPPGEIDRIVSAPCGPTIPLSWRPVALAYCARPPAMVSGPAARSGHCTVCPFFVTMVRLTRAEDASAYVPSNADGGNPCASAATGTPANAAIHSHLTPRRIDPLPPCNVR